MKNNTILKRIGCMALAIVITGFSAISCGFPLKTGQAASTAWTRVDGVFVNSLGDEIEGAVLKGIDVSYHNKDIDWEQVKASDIDYAIIRCGYGQDYENQDDVKWEEYASACTELGIPFGTYLYSYATTVSAAKSEAEHVLRVIEGYQLTYPVYYDMEDSKQAGTTATRKAQMAEVFCSTIEAAGYQVGIYANTDWFTNKLTDSYFDSCDKWVAQYNATCKYTGNYRMWQCTSSGQVPGISTKVDLNFWYDQPPIYQGNIPEMNAGNTGNVGDNSTAQPGDTSSSIGDPNTGNNTVTGENQGIGNNSSTGNNQGIDNNLNSGNNQNQGNTVNTGENQTSGNPSNTGQDISVDSTGSEIEKQPDSEITENPEDKNNSGENSNIGNNSSSGNQQGTDIDTDSDNDKDQNQENNNDYIENPEEKEDKPTLTISQNTLTLSYGGTSVLTANQPVKWYSSDKEVVKIGSKGKVTPIGVGEAVITAETSSGETAECSVIVKKPIKDTNIEEIPSQQFTGSQICPEPIVIDEDKILEKGTDYKVSYMDNMGKGTAIVTIKGKGYYTGDIDVNFQIIPKEKLAVPIMNSISSKKRVVTLKWKKVSKASGYEIYRSTTKKGTYTLQKTLTKKSKVTYKDKKLIKGKKYYYKIRSYRIIDNKKQYSTYAKVNIRV